MLPYKKVNFTTCSQKCKCKWCGKDYEIGFWGDTAFCSPKCKSESGK